MEQKEKEKKTASRRRLGPETSLTMVEVSYGKRFVPGEID